MDPKYVHSPAVSPDRKSEAPEIAPPVGEPPEPAPERTGGESLTDAVFRTIEEQVRANPMAAVISGAVFGLVVGVLLRRL